MTTVEKIALGQALLDNAFSVASRVYPIARALLKGEEPSAEDLEAIEEMERGVDAESVAMRGNLQRAIQARREREESDGT